MCHVVVAVIMAGCQLEIQTNIQAENSNLDEYDVEKKCKKLEDFM